jgi:hypothetical protein
VISDVTGSRYSFLADFAHDEWVTVYGGDLPVPVDVRVDRAPDGRYVFTGLRIGVAVQAEVNANVLREIRLAEILADYFETFRPDVRAEMEASLADLSVPREPPGRGPGADTLRAFALTYLTELARQPHRAMSAAAKAHNISRATAHRWAALCRGRGYLPGGDPKEPSS